MSSPHDAANSTSAPVIAADANAALVRGRVVELRSRVDVAMVVRFARVAGVIETRGYDVVSEMPIRIGRPQGRTAIGMVGWGHTCATSALEDPLVEFGLELRATRRAAAFTPQGGGRGDGGVGR